jgi:secondary thiamine-phosphate synthase enzyme
MKKLSVRTNSQIEMLDISSRIEETVKESGVTEGVCYLFVPHTTAAVTINEGADPSVKSDILKELDKNIPLDDNYQHREGNSAAHIKASIIGSSEIILVDSGRLSLGTWQSVFFCEFDGPRSRTILVKVMGE